MKATISMEGIWQFLQSLELSDRSKTWLADKLLESTHVSQKEETEDDEYISKEEILAGIDAGLKDMKAGRSKTFDEFMRDWDDEI